MGSLQADIIYLNVTKMENEQLEQVKQETTAGQDLRTSDPKRELLSSIGLFIGMELLGSWFGVGAALGSKMFNSSRKAYKQIIKWQKKIK